MLVATDFDGTLAPIVADPDAAAPAAGAVAALSVLARRPGFAVAVVSGRSLEDLRRRCAPPGAWLIGGHGNEIAAPEVSEASLSAPPRGALASNAAAPPARELAAAQAAMAAALPRWPGTWLEVKPWSVAVHYRRAPEFAAPVLAFAAELARRFRLRLIPGNQIAELLPRRARDKGRTLLALRRQWRCDLAFYFGDEATDEDVFARADEQLVGVHVGASAAVPAGGATEEPRWDDRDTKAEFWLSAPEEVVEVLEQLPAIRDGAAAADLAPKLVSEA